jgi:hypothetical protein
MEEGEIEVVTTRIPTAGWMLAREM